METTPGEKNTPAEYGETAQVARVDANTRYISVTVGGDDVDFSGVGHSCAEYILVKKTGYVGAKLSCKDEISKQESKMPELEKDLAALYEQLLSRAAPDARLVVAGYPRILPKVYPKNLTKLHGTPFCTFDHLHAIGSIGMPVPDAKRVAEFVSQLNDTVRAAAATADQHNPGQVVYANIYPESVPRNCKGTTPGATVTGLELSPGLNGIGPLGAISSATFHPTRAGQKVYARAVQAAFKVPRPNPGGDASWTAEQIPDPAGVSDVSLGGVACVRKTCVAAGSADDGADRPVGVLASSTDSGQTWATTTSSSTPPTATQSQFSITPNSCLVSGECFAAGSYETSENGSNPDYPLFAIFADGKWSETLAPTPSDAVIHSGTFYGPVACGSATCTAAGEYYKADGTQGTMIATYRNGAWSAMEAPSPDDAASDGGSLVLYATACAGNGTCVAVGSYYDAAGTRWAVIETLGPKGWTAVGHAVPANGDGGGSALYSVSCGTVVCAATGVYEIDPFVGGSAEFFATLENGQWTFQEPSLPSNTADVISEDGNVSCAGTTCAAVGRYNAWLGGSNYWTTMVSTFSNGQWSTIAIPRPSDAYPASGGDSPWVSCGAEGNCALVAGYYVDDPQAPRKSTASKLVGSLKDGSWSVTPLALPAGGAAHSNYVDNVSCGMTSCVVATQYLDANGARLGMLGTLGSSGWQVTADPMLPDSDGANSYVTSTACGDSSCAAVGWYIDSSGAGHGVAYSLTD